MKSDSSSSEDVKVLLPISLLVAFCTCRIVCTVRVKHVRRLFKWHSAFFDFGCGVWEKPAGYPSLDKYCIKNSIFLGSQVLLGLNKFTKVEFQEYRNIMQLHLNLETQTFFGNLNYEVEYTLLFRVFRTFLG